MQFFVHSHSDHVFSRLSAECPLLSRGSFVPAAAAAGDHWLVFSFSFFLLQDPLLCADQENECVAQYITGVVLHSVRTDSLNDKFHQLLLIMRESFANSVGEFPSLSSPFQHNKSRNLNRNTRVVLIIFLFPPLGKETAEQMC